MNSKHWNVPDWVIGLALLFSIACNAILPAPTPTPVPPTRTPLPTATATITATAKPTPTATFVPDYNGIWNGTTSQAKPISITVQYDEVTSVSVDVDVKGNRCTKNLKGSLEVSGPITHKAFQTTTSGSYGTFTIYGVFDSEESVTGTLV